MAGLDFETVSGQLTINNVELRCPAWHVFSLRPLWSSPSRRGRASIFPTVPGGRANRRRATVTQRTLRIYITGEVDQDGTPVEPCTEEAYGAQLEANILFLQENVTDLADVPPRGELEAVLTMPSGTERTGLVQVLGLELDEGIQPFELAVGDIVIELLDGALREEVSA